MNKTVLNILFFLFCAAVLTLSLRGLSGNPTAKELNTNTWKENGPLELSPERGRFVLLYSLVENHSFSFTPELARFASPDVAYKDGKYLSLFAPGVSFIAIPGYILGKYFGIAQVGAFAMIAFFAVLNAFLLRAIAVRMGAHPLAGIVAAITFLFASPAFAYAVTLYQHHISTFLILLSFYLLIRYKSIAALAGIWIMTAFTFVVDYPNAFMMLPLALAALGKITLVEKIGDKISVRFSFLRLFSIAVVVIPMAFLLWFNHMSYGNPLQLSGTIERAIEVKPDGTPLLESEVYKAQLKEKNIKVVAPTANLSLLSPFKNRDMINGFYTHFLSADRGMIMYTPVIILGIIGLLFSLREKVKYTGLLTAIIGFNVLLYSMWGDPYGGWAFGSRYLIPTYAVLSIFLAIALTRFVKYNLFLLLFFTVFSYSVAVNTLGAITSNRIPPQVEALGLEKTSGIRQDYTYMRNLDLLNKNVSKSYVFGTYAGKVISAWDYYIYLTLFIISVTSAFLMWFKIRNKKEGGYHAV